MLIPKSEATYGNIPIMANSAIPNAKVTKASANTV